MGSPNVTDDNVSIASDEATYCSSTTSSDDSSSVSTDYTSYTISSSTSDLSDTIITRSISDNNDTNITSSISETNGPRSSGAETISFTSPTLISYLFGGETEETNNSEGPSNKGSKYNRKRSDSADTQTSLGKSEQLSDGLADAKPYYHQFKTRISFLRNDLLISVITFSKTAPSDAFNISMNTLVDSAFSPSSKTYNEIDFSISSEENFSVNKAKLNCIQNYYDVSKSKTNFNENTGSVQSTTSEERREEAKARTGLRKEKKQKDGFSDPHDTQEFEEPSTAHFIDNGRQYPCRQEEQFWRRLLYG